MSVRPLALTLALTLASSGILAGCIGNSEGGAVDDPTLNDEPAPALNETDTPDGRGEIAAFKETNATEKGLGGMAHDHDYWNGETRKIIYQDDIGLIPLPLTPNGYPVGTSIADFNIPAPNLVFEGTSSLELLFSGVCVLYSGGARGVANPAGCVPSQTVTILVDYITAADNPGEWRKAGTVTPESPLIIPVKPLETDMPHSVASLWLFRIYTEQPDAFQFNLTVTAVKGEQVAKWPPHPDLYANGPERVIFDGPFATTVNSAVTFFMTGEDTNWFYPEKVISWGTDKLVVDVTDVTFTAASPTTPTPLYMYLDYYNASFAPKIGNGGTSGGSARDEGSDGTSFHFEIPVDAYGYDSPYGTKSRWAFRMLAKFEETVPKALGGWEDALVCTSCHEYTISYNLKIVAVGHSTGEDGMMDMMNADPEEPEAPTEPTEPTTDSPATLPVPTLSRTA